MWRHDREPVAFGSHLGRLPLAAFAIASASTDDEPLRVDLVSKP